jgi:hypothetical protein
MEPRAHQHRPQLEEAQQPLAAASAQGLQTELLLQQYAASHGLQLEIWHHCSSCSCCAGSGSGAAAAGSIGPGSHGTCAMLTGDAGAGSARVLARGVGDVSLHVLLFQPVRAHVGV